MPPSRPIPRRRFITDEPTLSLAETLPGNAHESFFGNSMSAYRILGPGSAERQRKPCASGIEKKKAVAIAVRNVSGRRRWSKLTEWLRPGLAD